MAKEQSPFYHLLPVRNDLDSHYDAPYPSLARSTMGGLTAPVLPPTKFVDDAIVHVVVKVRNESDRTNRHSSVTLESSP